MRYRHRPLVKLVRLLQFGCIELQMARNERRRRRVMRWARQADRIDSNELWGLACAFGAKDYASMARRIDNMINSSTKQRRYNKRPYGTLPIRLVWETEAYDDHN